LLFSKISFSFIENNCKSKVNRTRSISDSDKKLLEQTKFLTKNLRNMKIGDKCFFYHTGKSKSIIGIAAIIKEAFLDKSDKTRKFVSVIVKALYPLKREVSLKEIKKNKDFRDFSLVKQSRLSVMKVSLKYWKKICKMGRV